MFYLAFWNKVSSQEPEAHGCPRGVILNLPNAAALRYSVVTRNQKVISLLLHTCNFATLVNRNVNFFLEICQRSGNPQDESHFFRRTSREFGDSSVSALLELQACATKPDVLCDFKRASRASVLLFVEQALHWVDAELSPGPAGDSLNQWDEIGLTAFIFSLPFILGSAHHWDCTQVVRTSDLKG